MSKKAGNATGDEAHRLTDVEVLIDTGFTRAEAEDICHVGQPVNGKGR